MRAPLTIAFLLASPLAALAQTQVLVDDRLHKKDVEDFSASVDLRGQYFVYSSIPNRMLNDYTGYRHSANEQMDITAHAYLMYNIRLDVQAYAWIGDNQWISRIGLIGELTYETPIDWISVGYGHHSWHNIDVDSATLIGHQQDMLFARFDLPMIEFDDADYLRFSLKTTYFISNGSPIFLKDIYIPNEVKAWSMIGAPIIGRFHEFYFEILPYVQFADGAQRVGISADFEYEVTPFLAPFISIEFLESSNGRSQSAIGIGLKVKLKR